MSDPQNRGEAAQAPDQSRLASKAVTLKQIREVVAVGGRSLLLGTSLASLSLAARPRQLMQYVADSLFLFHAMSGRRGVPQKSVGEVLSSSGPHSVRLGNLDSKHAWFPPQAAYTQDIVSLCLICRILEPRLVFEIGTLWGYTAYHFALNTPDDARICTLDLPRDGTAQASLPVGVIDRAHIHERSVRDPYCFQGSPEASKITCLVGDSATFDFTPYRGKVDLFFIDGAHSYDYARSDTLRALECCHPGSVIAWHDYGKASVPGVTRWLDEFARKWPVYSIPGGSVAFMIVPPAASKES